MNTKKKPVNYGPGAYHNQVVLAGRKQGSHKPKAEKRKKDKLRREIQAAY